MLSLILIAKLIIAGLLFGSSLTVEGRSFLSKYRKHILWIVFLIIIIILIYYSYQHYQFWNTSEFTKSLNSDQSFSEELKKYGVDFAAILLDPLFRGINTTIKFVFPSYTGGTYLLFFLLTRLWGEYIISFIFALLFLWAMLYLNHRFESRFFYDEEPYFGAVAIFLTGWPGWLYYLIILLTLFLLFNFFGTVMARRKTNMARSDVQGTEDSQYFPPEADPPLAEGSRMSEASVVVGGQHFGSPTSKEISGSTRFSFYYFWFPVAIAIIIIMAYTQQTLPYFNLLKI